MSSILNRVMCVTKINVCGRSTHEMRSLLWGVGGQDGVAAMLAMAAMCSVAVAMLVVRRRRVLYGLYGSSAERQPLNP